MVGVACGPTPSDGGGLVFRRPHLFIYDYRRERDRTMPPILILAAVAWAMAAAAMAALWAWQRRVQNGAVGDAGWTALVAGLAVFYATQANGMAGRRLAIASMMGSWGARLAIHLLHDRGLGRRDADRDADLRSRFGVRANTRFFWMSQIAAALAVLFSSPALVAAVNPAPEFSALEYM